MQGKDNIFSYLSDDNLSELSNYMRCKNLSAGEMLWEEGSDCDYVAFIISGEIEVRKNLDFGKQVLVGKYTKGAVVGELCILDDSPRAVTAIAHDDVRLAIIPRENFNILINKHPELGSMLLKGMLLSVSVRLRKSFERLSTFF